MIQSKRFNVLLVGLFVLVAVAACQSAVAEDVVHAVSGIVRSVDKGTKTMVVKTADERITPSSGRTNNSDLHEALVLTLAWLIDGRRPCPRGPRRSWCTSSTGEAFCAAMFYDRTMQDQATGRGTGGAKQDVRMMQADVEAATQKITREQSELTYAKYKHQLLETMMKIKNGGYPLHSPHCYKL